MESFHRRNTPWESQKWPFSILPLPQNLCPWIHNCLWKAITLRVLCLQRALTMSLWFANASVLLLKAEWIRKETVSLTLEDRMFSTPLSHLTSYEPGERFPDVMQWFPKCDFWRTWRKTVSSCIPVETFSDLQPEVVLTRLKTSLILYSSYLFIENRDYSSSFYFVWNKTPGPQSNGSIILNHWIKKSWAPWSIMGPDELLCLLWWPHVDAFLHES